MEAAIRDAVDWERSMATCGPAGLRASVENRVVESSSFEVDRRARRAKAEDVEKVRKHLLLDGLGENSAWWFVTGATLKG